jgi:protein TonB
MRIGGWVLVVLATSVAARPARAQAPDSQPHSEDAVEQRPVLVAGSCRPPSYPIQLRLARVEGRVLLQFVVDTQGNVEPGSVTVLQSAHRLFDAPARQAILSCRYRPGRFANRAVRVRVQAPVVFRLTTRP